MKEDQNHATAKDRAAAEIIRALGPGPLESKDLQRAITGAGVARTTFEAARHRLRIAGSIRVSRPISSSHPYITELTTSGRDLFDGLAK